VRYSHSYDVNIIDAFLESTENLDLTTENCDNKNVLEILLNNKKYSNNEHFDVFLKKISMKLLSNEIHNKNLKILTLLKLYLPKNIVDYIIYEYIKKN